MRKLAIALFIVVLVLDQASKLWVEQVFVLGESLQLLPFFSLTLVRNQGAAWGIFQGAQLWLALFGVVVAALAMCFWKRLFGSARHLLPIQGLLLAGILGNVVDRIRLGYVVDFFDFYWNAWHFPCFNVADSAICVSVFLLLLLQQKSTDKAS